MKVKKEYYIIKCHNCNIEKEIDKKRWDDMYPAWPTCQQCFERMTFTHAGVRNEEEK